MRLRVGRQRHEDDVLTATALDSSAGGDAARVGIQDDLQQQRRVVSRGAGVVVVVALIKDRHVQLVVDRITQGVLESAG